MVQGYPAREKARRKAREMSTVLEPGDRVSKKNGTFGCVIAVHQDNGKIEVRLECGGSASWSVSDAFYAPCANEIARRSQIIREMNNTELRPVNEGWVKNGDKKNLCSNKSAKRIGRPRRTMQQIEREAFEEAIKACNGNKAEAAKTLGISYRTMLRRMKGWQEIDRLDTKRARSANMAHGTDSDTVLECEGREKRAAEPQEFQDCGPTAEGNRENGY